MQKLTRIVATFFGVGFLPWAPGTWASLLAAVLAWFLGGSLVYWTVAFSTVGLLVCRQARLVFRDEDPKQFVMDEVCGMFLGVLWLPKSIPLFVAAFFLFRVLDIWKPWPISKVQNIDRPWSIMGDDLLAGVFVNLILQAVAGIVS